MTDKEKSGYDVIPNDPQTWDMHHASNATKKNTKVGMRFLKQVEARMKIQNVSEIKDATE